jgi:SOS response regulatory protein OraA/RecX
MLLEEWNIDDAKEVWYEEGLEDGLEKGREEGQKAILDLVRQGYSPEQIESMLSQG